jgi:hypothetical protein
MELGISFREMIATAIVSSTTFQGLKLKAGSFENILDA